MPTREYDATLEALEIVEIPSTADIDAEEIPDGVKITVTRNDGTVKEVTVYDGEDGQTGPQGLPGNDGVGIESMEEETTGLNHHITVTLTNGETAEFDLEDGRGILNIEKTSTAGLVDTYTITLDDGAVITFDVTNGAQGPKGDTGSTGPTGPAGSDGFSPIATVSKTGTVTTVTVTDKNGTTTAQISDGQTGPTGPQGPQGDDYVLTATDKQDIADIVLSELVDGNNTAY